MNDSKNQNEAQAVRAITQENESASAGAGVTGQTEETTQATACATIADCHPSLPGSNPRIGGAALTKEPELLTGAPEGQCPVSECGQETTYQRALSDEGEPDEGERTVSGFSRKSLSQPKDKSDGSGPGRTANQLPNEKRQGAAERKLRVLRKKVGI